MVFQQEVIFAGGSVRLCPQPAIQTIFLAIANSPLPNRAAAACGFDSGHQALTSVTARLIFPARNVQARALNLSPQGSQWPSNYKH
jgi:hypothetical protein